MTTLLLYFNASCFYIYVFTVSLYPNLSFSFFSWSIDSQALISILGGTSSVTTSMVRGDLRTFRPPADGLDDGLGDAVRPAALA